MSDLTNIGLIGLDTSHVEAFTKLLNKKDDPYHVPGGRVTAGFPGGTQGWELSIGRVAGFTEKLKAMGVTIVDSPEAVAEQCDVIFISAVDGRVHRELLEKVIGAGKPVFIDKPFATSSADAAAMVDMAATAGVPLMSCSSLRFAVPLVEALADDQHGPVRGIDVFGPMAIQPELPGLFWYGCHGIEMVVTAMGAGCRSVTASVNDQADVYTLHWDDGRVATYRGNREMHSFFGATVHREKGFQQVDIHSSDKPYYAGMLEAIVASLPHGRSPIPAEQMLDVVRIMEAGNQSRQTGETVELESLDALAAK